MVINMNSAFKTTKYAELVNQAQQKRLLKTDPNGIARFIPLNRLYQEHESTFKSNSNTYNLNIIFKGTEHESVEYINISELVWILKHVDNLDPERIKNADVTVPILITKYRNKELVIDGLHRLAKAVQSRMEQIPYKRVSKELFEKSMIQSMLMNLSKEEVEPVYINW